MTRLRTLLGVGLVAAVVAVNAGPARAQSSSDTPKATEIGVTPTEIHIAVEADVDNPFVPGLFQGIVDGVRAGAKYLNSKAGGGGLAGRKVVVDFIDSKLNSNEARNGVITARQDDFAMVGTSALFLPNVDDMVSCDDQAGAATGLPDVAAIVTGVPESCSPVTFPINPPQLDLQHQGRAPADVLRQPGRRAVPARARTRTTSTARMLAGNDTKDALRGATAIIDTVDQRGDQGRPEGHALGPRPAERLHARRHPDEERRLRTSRSRPWRSPTRCELRSEAQLQGLTDPNFVWECTTCYDNADRTTTPTSWTART